MEDELMLQLTHAAATQVAEARQSQGLPETAGLRVSGEPRSEGEMALRVAFAAVPAEDDRVIEQEGTLMFLAPEVVEPLASAALDVEETSEGTRLVLTQQDTGEVD